MNWRSNGERDEGMSMHVAIEQLIFRAHTNSHKRPPYTKNASRVALAHRAARGWPHAARVPGLVATGTSGRPAQQAMRLVRPAGSSRRAERRAWLVNWLKRTQTSDGEDGLAVSEHGEREVGQR